MARNPHQRPAFALPGPHVVGLPPKTMAPTNSHPPTRIAGADRELGKPSPKARDMGLRPSAVRDTTPRRPPACWVGESACGGRVRVRRNLINNPARPFACALRRSNLEPDPEIRFVGKADEELRAPALSPVFPHAALHVDREGQMVWVTDAPHRPATARANQVFKFQPGRQAAASRSASPARRASGPDEFNAPFGPS